MRTSKVAEKVREYVFTHPFVRECLKEGIVNYSALARQILRELRRLNTHASEGSVKMALIRIRDELLRTSEEIATKVREVIASSVISLQTDLAVIEVRRYVAIPNLGKIAEIVGRSRFFHVIYGEVSFSLIVPHEVVDELLEVVGKENVIRIVCDQTAIIIVSPDDVVETPGVLAYISSALASHGINVTHATSCFRETVIVCDREEATKAYAILEELISAARKPEASGRERLLLSES